MVSVTLPRRRSWTSVSEARPRSSPARAAVSGGASRSVAREGCGVALCARGQAALEEAAAEVRGHGVEAVTVVADVTTEAGVGSAVDATLAAFGRIDVLVNNVGGSTGSSFQETPIEGVQEAAGNRPQSHPGCSRVSPGGPPHAGAWGGCHRQRGVHLRARVGRRLHSPADLHRGQGGGDRHVQGSGDGAGALPGSGSTRWPRARSSSRVGAGSGERARIPTASPPSSRPTCRSAALGGSRRWAGSWPSSSRTPPAWSSAPVSPWTAASRALSSEISVEHAPRFVHGRSARGRELLAQVVADLERARQALGNRLRQGDEGVDLPGTRGTRRRPRRPSAGGRRTRAPRPEGGGRPAAMTSAGGWPERSEARRVRPARRPGPRHSGGTAACTTRCGRAG